jgi:acetamidase/formamidase
MPFVACTAPVTRRAKLPASPDTDEGTAAQGDGEVGQMAIECPLERVQLSLSVRQDVPLAAPCALTPTAWITFGFDEISTRLSSK